MAALRSSTTLNSVLNIHRSQGLLCHIPQVGSLIYFNQRNSAPHNALVYNHFVRGYSENTKELGRAKRLWMKIGGLMKAFMSGTKTLYKDVKRMYRLQTREGNYVIGKQAPKEIAPGKLDFALKREELQFVYQTKRDLMRMLPTIIVFFIPVLGYIVPVVAFMYPDKLLSQHFWTEEQKQQFAESTFAARMEHFKALAVQIRNNGSQEGRRLLEELRKQFDSPGEDVPTVKKSPKAHLASLISGWGVASKLPLPLRFQERRMEKHLYYLFTTDWLIKTEGGVDRLTVEEVTQACMERGLKVEAEDKMRNALHRWVRLSTTFRECPTSLLAHFPVVQFTR